MEQNYIEESFQQKCTFDNLIGTFKRDTQCLLELVFRIHNFWIGFTWNAHIPSPKSRSCLRPLLLGFLSWCLFRWSHNVSLSIYIFSRFALPKLLRFFLWDETILDSSEMMIHWKETASLPKKAYNNFSRPNKKNKVLFWQNEKPARNCYL